MKMHFVTVAVLVSCIFSNRLFAQQVPPISSEGYQLAWSEEFNNDGLPDSAVWRYERGLVRNHEAQWYQPGNAFCKNGLLVIEARREDVANPKFERGSSDWRKKDSLVHYTSSSINTSGKKQWLYGRFEMRGRIDIRSGIWPAWWTLGAEKPWPANGEIDIMEFYRKQLLANIACLGANGKPEWHSKIVPTDSLGGEKWASEFHVWRMDWTPGAITLSIDGKVLNEVSLATLENKDGSLFNPFTQPHYMLLNVAIGGDNGGEPSGTIFPSRFEVDWVRVWQKK